MKTKYQDMGDRAFLLVPVFDERVKDCPLDSTGALVYGYLLFLARNKKPERRNTSRTRISLSLRLDKKAVDKAVRFLIARGLVGEVGSRVEAVEPVEGSCGWFRRRLRSRGRWYDRFVVDRVFLPKSSTTLSVRTNQLFWRLVRISHPVAGMPGYHNAGAHPDKPPRHLSAKYLARGINCDRRTTTRALTRLQGLKLITIQQVLPRKFVVGIPPVGELAALWRDGWKRVRREEKPAEITAESLFAVPSTSALEPSRETQTQVGLFATGFGIVGRDLEEIITKVTTCRVPPTDWKPLLTLADEIHRANREKDPDKYKMRHCGRLFKRMLDDFIATRDAGQQIRSENVHTPRGYDEMESQYLLNGWATHQAWVLLRQAVSVEQLPLRHGGYVPCRFHWEEVHSIAKAAKRDYERFKEDVAARIFGASKNKDECPWYVAWMSQQPIPDWDEAPLEALGVRRWDFQEVKSHAEELVVTLDDRGDEVRSRTLANLLIKYGCKEAAGKTGKEVRKAITTVFERVMKDGVREAAGGLAEARAEKHDPTPA